MMQGLIRGILASALLIAVCAWGPSTFFTIWPELL